MSLLASEIKERLSKSGVESAAFESREILKEAEKYGELYAEKIEEFTRRRCLGEPLQYVFGEWDFYGRRIFCRKDVLIPRPETEILVELALKLTVDRGHIKVLDLCCGSGCIGLTIAKERHADVTLVDISKDALKLTADNAKLFGVKVEIVKRSVFDSPLEQKFDLLVTNPPYIKRCELKDLQSEVQHEPMLALDGGEDGFDFYREIAGKWKNSLIQGGIFLAEVGIGQAQELAAMLVQEGFSDVRVHRDLSGIERIVSAVR